MTTGTVYAVHWHRHRRYATPHDDRDGALMSLLFLEDSGHEDGVPEALVIGDLSDESAWITGDDLNALIVERDRKRDRERTGHATPRQDCRKCGGQLGRTITAPDGAELFVYCDRCGGTGLEHL